MPLPFTKDFGPYSSRDTEVKLAKVMQDVADWSAKDSANNALLEGELAYWDLVVRLQNLLALDRHNRNLKSLLDKTHRLYDDRLCTEYDLALVKSAYTKSVDGMEQGLPRIAPHPTDWLNLLMPEAGLSFSPRDMLFLPICLFPRFRVKTTLRMSPEIRAMGVSSLRSRLPKSRRNTVATRRFPTCPRASPSL